MDVPSIETDRLVLAAYRIEDLEDSVAMWSDPAVVRLLGGRALSTQEVWSRLLRHAGHWALLGFGYWAIRDRASGRFAGEVGFADLRRELDPPLVGVPEIGWALASWAHGRGLATEAARAVVAWGTRRFGRRRTVCLIDPENHASIRVAEKCGYRPWTRTVYQGEPMLLYERLPDGKG